MKHATSNSADLGATPTPSLASVLSSLNWGGTSSYPSYEGRMEGAPVGGGTPAAATPSADGGAGTGTPATPAGSPPATPGQTPGGSPATNPPSGNEANLATLRQNYETLKPWETVAKQFKDPAQVSQYASTYQKMFTEGAKLAQQLGYTEDSFKQAFAEDPVDVLATLRGEASKANPQLAEQQRIAKLAEEAAKKALTPVQQELNRQKTEAAIQKYEGEIDRLLSDDKLGFGPNVAPEVKDAMLDLVDSLIPDSVLEEIKTHGKLSGVQAVFDQAKARLITVVNAYNKMVNTRNAAPVNIPGRRPANPPSNPAANPGGGQKDFSKMTLDDIINNPDALPGVAAGKY